MLLIRCIDKYDKNYILNLNIFKNYFYFSYQLHYIILTVFFYNKFHSIKHNITTKVFQSKMKMKNLFCPLKNVGTCLKQE